MNSSFRGDLAIDWWPQSDQGTSAALVAFSDDRQVLVGPNGPMLDASLVNQGHTVGTISDVSVHCVRWSDAAPKGYQWMPLRACILSHPDDLTFIALSAGIQRLEFIEEHRFCGRCGSANHSNPGDSGVRCSDADCALVSYPRISPSVIVLVTRGSQCLLARSPRFEPGMYSTLAGFLEAGESAEHAIRREIREEVGIEVTRPRYFATQSWPFKNSLMMGYFAEWANGDIQVDGVEIVDAQWFEADKLPGLPPASSISRALIDTWLGQRDPELLPDL